MLRCLIGGLISAALVIPTAGCSRQTCEVVEPRPVELVEAYTCVDSPAEADFMVVVEYEVPYGLKYSKTVYFKHKLPSNVAYLDDDTTIEYSCGGPSFMGSCAKGPGGYCNTLLSCDATIKGIEVELSIRWGGKTNGKVEEKASIPWNELPKEIHRDDLTLKIDRRPVDKPKAGGDKSPTP